MKKLVVTLLSTILLGACSSEPPKPVAEFHWFEYQGKDEIFAAPLADDQYQNPVAAGFYPDPSITRKGDDYYMAVSSFAYAPGVPILHSKDLVNWELIGHALTRPSQLDIEGLRTSRGVFAPTIRYHDGLFYMITTAVDTGGNFFVTAEDPAGPWSEPYWLPEIGGIDPDIFFDDNGKVYISHNDAPEGEPLYEGHRAIWLWEYDLAAKKVVADSGRVIVNGGVDIAKKPIWIEAPHIYKINGWYYLLCAEGGTADQHSEVVFRTRDMAEPFVPYEGNPILTQRDLDIDRPQPITTAGHADIVQTPNGDWWAVFLATRAYDKTYYNSGRESFLLPVTWENEWPHILPAGEAIPYRLTKPDLPASPVETPLTGNFTWRDDFDASELGLHWNLLRSFNQQWLSFDDGLLTMKPQGVKLSELQQPAFVSRRQQHMAYEASTSLILPQADGVSAGIAAYQNQYFHYYLGVKRQGDKYTIFLEQAKGDEPQIIASMQVKAAAGDAINLTIEGDKADISFAFQLKGEDKQYLAQQLDGKLLSTAVAKGFVGTMLGMHSRIEP